jgi:6-phosphogluconolactonase
MNTLSKFSSRELLDIKLAQSVTDILSKAITENGKASLAVSGGSTPKGFCNIIKNQY